MRFTIERIRTLVLAAGILLVMALAGFLAMDKWKSKLSSRDLPTKLGKNIVQEASGVTYVEAHGGHILFRIHATRAEQLQNQHALLHEVQIQFYSKDGSVDSISGNDFQYDQKTGVGAAQGPVDITLTRPPEMGAKGAKPSEEPPGAGTVHVKTSGLAFNQNTGVMTTAKEVDFWLANGSGTAVGATYDSQQGYLVLDSAVELNTDRGGRKVVIHARHAEMEHNSQVARLTNAQADFKTGQANAGLAKIWFRGDGTAQRLEATSGFALATTGGGRVTAPAGTLLFSDHNEPKSGDLQGGVKLNSVSAGRQLQGSSPEAHLEFSKAGELRLLKLSDGAEIESETLSGAGTKAIKVSRTWRSPVAQVDFRPKAKGGIEPADLHGSGGVVVTSGLQRGSAAPVLPARLTADEVTGEFGTGSELTAMDGMGHAKLEQTAADGARQTAWGDRIDAQFAPAAEKAGKPKGSPVEAAEIQSAVLEGHVVLVQQPAQKPGAQAGPPLWATAGRATYVGAEQRLKLTQSPRVEEGGLNLTADTIDVTRQSGEAFAHGDVKATWLQTGAETASNPAAAAHAAVPAGAGFGGQAPAHVIADEAQLKEASGEAVFRGHARLWQDANSVAAPVIVLNRKKQTLEAHSSMRAEPVEAVLLETREAAGEMTPARASQHKKEAEPGAPALIRVRGGELHYSDAEHQAVMSSGTLGEVVTEAGGATCRAHEVTLLLRPRGSTNQTAKVERVTANGDVVVSSEGRRGVGAKLVYTSMNGEYALTGTPAKPPRLTDPTRGTATGAALIFNSRNDSVSIEGRGQETRTDTTAPK
jgi:lipopolysaccharide export system protein LptA